VPRYRYDQLMRLGWKVFLPISLGYVAIVLFAGLEPIAGLKGPVCAERKDPVISLAGK